MSLSREVGYAVIGLVSLVGCTSHRPNAVVQDAAHSAYTVRLEYAESRAGQYGVVWFVSWKF